MRPENQRSAVASARGRPAAWQRLSAWAGARALLLIVGDESPDSGNGDTPPAIDGTPRALRDEVPSGHLRASRLLCMHLSPPLFDNRVSDANFE